MTMTGGCGSADSARGRLFTLSSGQSDFAQPTEGDGNQRLGVEYLAEAQGGIESILGPIVVPLDEGSQALAYQPEIGLEAACVPERAKELSALRDHYLGSLEVTLVGDGNGKVGQQESRLPLIAKLPGERDRL